MGRVKEEHPNDGVVNPEVDVNKMKKADAIAYLEDQVELEKTHGRVRALKGFLGGIVFTGLVGAGLFAWHEDAEKSELTGPQHIQAALEIANKDCKDDASAQLEEVVLDPSKTIADNETIINKSISDGMIACISDRTGLTPEYVAEQDLAIPVVAVVNGQVSISGN